MPQDGFVQELEAKLFEAGEQLKIYKKVEQQIDFLNRINKQLQNEKLALREKLQRAVDKISFMEDEKVQHMSNYYGSKLSEEAANLEIKKLNTALTESQKEISQLKMTNEELSAGRKTLEQTILDLKQSTNLTEESNRKKQKAYEDQISALKKIISKMEEKLQLNQESSTTSNETNSH